ncbi:MAG TPA: hypothetical protein PKK59_07590 [Anaerolineaceae bacterium]|nr:hypothetical protein [Anaerolineaceae bacterium]
MGFTSASPSLMPLSRRQACTCGVMFTNPRRAGRFSVSSLR